MPTPDHNMYMGNSIFYLRDGGISMRDLISKLREATYRYHENMEECEEWLF